MASETGGVKPMMLEGRLVRERERLLGMTDTDRKNRQTWLKDQQLSPSEPCNVHEYNKQLMNPIRRAYRFPLDMIFKALNPVLGERRSQIARYATGKVLLCLFGVYATTYYFKYNTNDWTRKGGWRVNSTRKAVVPGDVNYPAPSSRSSPADYGTRGFKKSPI